MVKKVQILRSQGGSCCPQVTELVSKIKEDQKLEFEIEELDISEHPELVQKYQLMISPAIIVDGKLEFRGMPQEKRLKEKLMS